MASSGKEDKEQLTLHIVRDEISKLGKDFARFNERLRKLEANIEKAHKDVSEVRNASEKIVSRFSLIKKVK